MPKRNDIKKVLIIGSGPIIIGQACEFDYSGTQACKALRKLGYQIVLVNSNPATIMTDPGMADVTYIEPLNVSIWKKVIANERPDALLPNLGGQTGLNISSQLFKEGILDKYGVQIIGVKADAIERGEDRQAFKNTMIQLGIEMPRSEIALSLEEVETDAISDGTDAFIPAIMEHIELAGIHSGDSACVLPPVSIPEKHRKTIEEYTKRIAIEHKVPYVTTMAAARAAAKGIAAYRHKEPTVFSMQRYHAGIK